MHSNETPITAAQRALIEFTTSAEADNLFNQLHTTLSVSIVNYLQPSERDDPYASATQITLEAWYYTLEIMKRLHALALEEKLKSVNN